MEQKHEIQWGVRCWENYVSEFALTDYEDVPEWVKIANKRHDPKNEKWYGL